MLIEPLFAGRADHEKGRHRAGQQHPRGGAEFYYPGRQHKGKGGPDEPRKDKPPHRVD